MLGKSLTFKQVYDLAKVEESTKAQMKIITQGEDIPLICTPFDTSKVLLIQIKGSSKETLVDSNHENRKLALQKIQNVSSVARAAITHEFV